MEVLTQPVTIKVSHGTYEADSLPTFIRWVSEGRVPDDGHVRCSAIVQDWTPAPDFCWSIVSRELTEAREERRSPDTDTSFCFHQVDQNAYRLAGTHALATITELRQAESRARRFAQLGRRPLTVMAVPSLKPWASDASAVGEALGRLEIPQKRLRERVWWFLTPADLEAVAAKAAPASEHAELLLEQLNLCATDPQMKEFRRWVAVVARWKRLLTATAFVDALIQGDMISGFERHLTPTDAPAVRELLEGEAHTLFFAKIGHALQSTDVEAVANALKVAKECALDFGEELRTALGDELERQTSLHVSRAYRLLAAVNRTEQSTPRVNAQFAEGAARIARDVLARVTSQFSNALSDHDLKVREAHDLTTELLYSTALAKTWADDFHGAQSLLREAARRTPTGSPLAVKIATALADVDKQTQTNDTFRDGKPPGNPTLFTLNGVGAKFYGNSDFDPATRSFMTTHYAVFLFVPIFPLARYRVREPVSDSYQILAKYPLSKANRWHLAVSCIGLVIALVLASAASSPGETSAPGTMNASALPGSPASDAEVGLPDAAKELDGKIEAGRAEMKILKSAADQVGIELDSLRSAISASEAELEQLEADYNAGRLEDEEMYERKRRSHNARVDQYNALLADRKKAVAAYNALLASDHQMVDAYNAIVGAKP